MHLSLKMIDHRNLWLWLDCHLGIKTAVSRILAHSLFPNTREKSKARILCWGTQLRKLTSFADLVK